MSELKAVWITEYDHRTDKLYKRPGCPDCEEAIGRFRNVYKCYNCGAAVEVEDEEMKAWLVIHEETRTETEDCPKFKVMDKNEAWERLESLAELLTDGEDGTFDIMHIWESDEARMDGDAE